MTASRKVLIADDQSSLLALIAEILEERLNCNVLIAMNGMEALELYKDRKVQLVITDMKMPKLSGYHLIKIIRQFDESLPIVAMSSDGIAKAEALSSGANAFLEKPFSLKQILELASKYLPPGKGAAPQG